MRTRRAALLVALVWAVSLGAMEAFGQQAAPAPWSEYVGSAVAVELDSHRVVAGVLDADSDEQTLWLRKSSAKTTLVSGFPADRVVAVRLTDGAQLPVVTPPKSIGNSDATAPATFFEDCVECDPQPRRRTTKSSRVAAIEVYADVANTDADVEVDGLRVWIRPVDRNGETVAVDGAAEFKLLGERSAWRGGRHIEREPRFVELQRWSQRLRADDADADGQIANLRFRNFHPDRDLDVLPEGVLHVRLTVPGQGVFAASYDHVVLRRWSFLRDDLQQATGSRYFRQESVSGELRQPNNRRGR